MSWNPKPVKFPNKVTGKLRIGNTAADYGVYGTGTLQKFELGTRYAVDDRVFRYGKAGSALNPQLGAFDHGAFFTDTLAVAAVIGDMHVTITTGGTSGHVTTGFGTKNNMVGGYFSQPGGTSKQFRRIVSHVAAPSGTTVKLYLDGPITIALALAAYCEFCPNPYLNLRQPGSNVRPVMGIPTTKIVSGSFGWFQTWGPCWVAPWSGADFAEAYETKAHFREGGNVYDAGTAAGAQLAGFIMGTRIAGGTWQNPPFLFLTITP